MNWVTLQILALRNLQNWLNSFKLDGDDDICGHCTKRRKTVAARRLGPLHSLMNLYVDAVTVPLKMVGINMNVSADGSKWALTLSGNGENRVCTPNIFFSVQKTTNTK